MSIPRYSRAPMAAIWEPENKFKIWLEIEAHACDAQAELGVIPKEAAKAVWDRGAFEVDRIDEIERETKHDVIAFLTNLAEHVGADARFVHQGMTSSDVLDTCLAIQLTQATDILIDNIDKLLAALKTRAHEHKLTPTIGRSHGIHAEPTTFGIKLAGHYAEFERNRERLKLARAEIATCAISGAVGTFANIDPSVEEHVAKALGLTPETVSTQTIPRDRHAMYFSVLAVVASSAESVGSIEPMGFAPSWVFYLADAMVMLLVLWHWIQSLSEGRDPSWVLSLGATLTAAGLGVYPWLRNLKYLEGASTLVHLPRWSWIRESNLDGEKKDFVVHLQYPPAAVEMLQTSWGEIQPRPVWFAGVPDLTPDQLQTFLREAQSFFQEQCEDSSSKASSCISAA